MLDRRTTMDSFLAEMYRFAPPGSRVMTCQFRGDPNADLKGKWRARPVLKTSQLDDGANVYLAVSAMYKNERGEYRRRKENFAGGLLLMIDDIGSGPGSKFPMDLIKVARPTALIETSPGNHQAVYMFDGLVSSATQFDALINGFITKQFLGKDTGMAGINRVFRPPFGVNGKPKYEGWHVVARSWAPDCRYPIGALAAAFGISMEEQLAAKIPRNATVGKGDLLRAFVDVRRALREAGMLKKERADVSGWQDIVCPWTNDHTDHADNGAAIREPAEENGWVGAFRCHHGGCEGRGWRELTDWLAADQSDMLERANENALGFEDYRS